MRTFRKTLILSLAFGLSLVALSLGTSTSTSAASESDTAYTYTAVSGDSYTELARSSIIKYDLSNDDIDLNAAQVTAAETWVTQEAGSPQIQVGQEVSVSKASVEKFAKQADALDENTTSRWQKYADAGSISTGELKDKVKATVSEVKEQVAQKVADQKAADDAKAQTDTKTEDTKDDKKTSRRWIIIAIIVLLVLAAITLIRSSNAKDE